MRKGTADFDQSTILQTKPTKKVSSARYGMMIPKTTSSPIAVPAQAITNSTITAMSDNMYLAFIDLHLAWRLHINDLGLKPHLVFYQFC